MEDTLYKVWYVVCIVETYFDERLDQSMCKVSKPLQAFEDFNYAHQVADFMAPFYDFDLRVVRSDSLDEVFR